MDKDIINWYALSTSITGNKYSIRKNKIPSQHKEKVNQLVEAIEQWSRSLNNDAKKTLTNPKPTKNNKKEPNKRTPKWGDAEFNPPTTKTIKRTKTKNTAKTKSQANKKLSPKQLQDMVNNMQGKDTLLY